MNATRALPASVIVLLLAALLLPSHPAHAQGRLHDDPTLARMSDAIVTGRVTAIGSARDPQVGLIYTYVTIAVDQRIKGAGIGSQLIVKQLGGRVDDVGMMVFHQPEFRVGEDVLLFLSERPRDATLQTTAMWQGKWNVGRNATTGAAWATRSPMTSVDRQLQPDPNRIEDTRALDPFLAELRAWSGPSDPTAAPTRRLNTRPAEMGSVVSSDGDRSPAFTFLGDARWNEPDTNLPVFVDIQAGGEPGLDGGGFSEINTARGVWNNSGSSLLLAGGSTVFEGASDDALCDATENSSSGRTRIFFDDPCDEISGDTLAVGGFFYSGFGGKTVNGVAFDRITAGFLMFSDAAQVQDALNTSACFRDVAIHEIGHTVGLGHTSVPGNIMQPTLDNACYAEAGLAVAALNGGLGSDDIAGINFMYPSPGVLTDDPTVPPGAPRALTYTLSADRIILEWLPPSSGGPVLSYQIQGGDAPGKLNYVNFDTFQNATKINLKIKDGEYFIRIKAKNGAGASITTSNEVNFVVEGNPDEPNPVFVQPTINFAAAPNGNLRVMGEIQNRFVGPGPPTFLRVDATLLGPGGGQVGSAAAYLQGRSRRLRESGEITDTTLAAGQRGCFMIQTNVPASQVANVELSGSYLIADNDALSGRLRMGGFSRNADDDGNLQMQGSASNIGSQMTYFNRVVFDVKTPQVQTCDVVFVTGSTINVPGFGSTNTALTPGQVGGFLNTTDVPFGALEVRYYTQWDEAAPATAAAGALARGSSDAAAALRRLQADRARLMEMLADGVAPSSAAAYRLRNDIEARLQQLEEQLATPGTTRRVPFPERLRFSVRRR